MTSNGVAANVWKERNAAIMQDERWEFCLFPGGYDMNEVRQQQTSLVHFLRQHVQAYRALPKTLKKHYILTKMIPQQHGHWYTYTKGRGFEVPDDEELAMKLREKMRPLQPPDGEGEDHDPQTKKPRSQRGRSPKNVMQHDASIMWSEETLQSPDAVADMAERISLRTMVQYLSETVEQQHAELKSYREKRNLPPEATRKQESCESLFSAIDEDENLWNDVVAMI